MIIYLVKGTEIIVPEKALVFKRYCAWSCEIKQNNASDEKSNKSLMIPWIKGLSLSGGSRGETRGTRPTPLFLDQTEARRDEIFFF